MTERMTCPRCGRPIAAYVPKGGDGSGVRLRRHRTPEGDDCRGSRRIIVDFDDAPVDDA
jgi:hypothetical protein